MKNQNFGDNRDLLKFDLVCRIAKEGLIERFTYIPMLTADETGKEAPQFCRHASSGGVENKELLAFLDNTIINDQRNIGQLESFFPDCGIKVTIYGKDKQFTQENRREYFEGIGKELLTKSLILIDPDKGLEEKTNGDGNLLFSELKGIYDKMDQDSYLMFTERFPYDMYKEYLAGRTADIQDQLEGAQPISLDDLDTIIFFVAKNEYLQMRLINMLEDYTQQYMKRIQENSEGCKPK